MLTDMSVSLRRLLLEDPHRSRTVLGVEAGHKLENSICLTCFDWLQCGFKNRIMHEQLNNNQSFRVKPDKLPCQVYRFVAFNVFDCWQVQHSALSLALIAKRSKQTQMSSKLNGESKKSSWFASKLRNTTARLSDYCTPRSSYQNPQVQHDVFNIKRMLRENDLITKVAPQPPSALGMC